MQKIFNIVVVVIIFAIMMTLMWTIERNVDLISDLTGVTSDISGLQNQIAKKQNKIVVDQTRVNFTTQTRIKDLWDILDMRRKYVYGGANKNIIALKHKLRKLQKQYKSLARRHYEQDKKKQEKEALRP